MIIWGDGTPTREFLYVADAARACRLALADYDDGEPVKVGSGDEIAIAELAILLADAVGYRGKISWDTTQPNRHQRRCLDSERTRPAFGFTTETRFEHDLAETSSGSRSKVASCPSAFAR